MRAGERVAHTKRRQLRRGGREDVNEAVVRQRGRYGGVVERRARGKAQLRYLRRGWRAGRRHTKVVTQWWTEGRVVKK